MKKALVSAAKAILTGTLIVVPAYLAILLLLKGMKSVVGLVRPFALLLPESLPAEKLLSLLMVLFLLFLIGAGVRTRVGLATRERFERAFFERIPGYALIRSLTQQVAGESSESARKPALFETGDGLVPAFLIEEIDAERVTVFVPSIPTPLAGAVFVAEKQRLHLVDVPFTEALRVISHWGSGARNLVAAMDRANRASD